MKYYLGVDHTHEMSEVISRDGRGRSAVDVTNVPGRIHTLGGRVGERSRPLESLEPRHMRIELHKSIIGMKPGCSPQLCR